MFAHIFTNRLRCLTRDRITVFWTMLFPIILALFFNAALRNIDKAESFSPVAAAVVDDAAYRSDDAFRAALAGVSTGDGRLFDLTVTTKDEAQTLLRSGKIYGYYEAGSPVSLTVGASGFESSLMQTFADSYLQMSAAAKDILTADPAAAPKLAQAAQAQADRLRDVPVSRAAADSSLAYFYALIAMACLYTGFWGVREVTDIQADLSPRAARVNVAPVKKSRAFFASMTPVCRSSLPRTTAARNAPPERPSRQPTREVRTTSPARAPKSMPRTKRRNASSRRFSAKLSTNEADMLAKNALLFLTGATVTRAARGERSA